MSKLLFCCASLPAFVPGVILCVYFNPIPAAIAKSFCVGPSLGGCDTERYYPPGVQAQPGADWSCFVCRARTNKGRAITAHFKWKDLSPAAVSGAICLRTPTKCPKCVLSAAQQAGDGSPAVPLCLILIPVKSLTSFLAHLCRNLLSLVYCKNEASSYQKKGLCGVIWL